MSSIFTPSDPSKCTSTSAWIWPTPIEPNARCRRAESAAERKKRIEFELAESKRAIEANLDTPVEFFIWPGGGYDDEAMNAGMKLYKAVTVSSAERWELRNLPNGDPRKISRRGVPSIEIRGKTRYTGGRYLIEFLNEFTGSRLARKKRQVLKTAYIAASNLGLWPEETL